MPLPSLLLRILLSLGLVFNGTGSAFASAHLSLAGLPGAAVEGDASHASPEASATCHEGNTAAGKPVLTAAAGASVILPDSGHDSDCCGSGNCRCPCLHGSSAALPMTADDTVVPMPQPVIQALRPAHDTPALPHLIRPPIS